MIKFSIIIPTCNREEKLLKTLNSIDKNKFPRKEYEIIVVDDYIKGKFKSRTKLGKSVRYFRNKKNMGPAFSRNFGAKMARGKYLLFTDDDCIVEENWLKKFDSFFKRNPKVVCVGGYLAPVKNNLIAFLEKLKNSILKIDFKEEEVGRQNLKTGFTNNCAYVKEIFLKEGGFNEKYKIPAGEDLDLSQRVAKNHLIAFTPIKVYHNQDYDLDYLLSIVYKQALGKNPPKKKKLIGIFKELPSLLINLLKKIRSYRR